MTVTDRAVFTLPPPRPVPPWTKGARMPLEVMVDSLRRQAEELATARAEITKAQARAADLAIAFALALHKQCPTGQNLEYRLFWDALQAERVELHSRVGAAVEQVEEEADVIGWVNAAATAGPGQVAEAIEPEIWLDGRLIHRAKLVCVRQSDLEPAPLAETEQIEEAPSQSGMQLEPPPPTLPNRAPGPPGVTA